MSDSLRLVSQPMTGQGSLTVRVAGFGAAANTEARAGLMLRADASRESAMAAVTLSKSGVVRFTRRSEAAAYTDVTDFTAAIPYWLRLTRTATGVACFHSPNGTTWTPVRQHGESAGLPLPDAGRRVDVQHGQCGHHDLVSG